MESPPEQDAPEKAALEEVYQTLRRLAAAKLRDERSDHTLQATALVHEAWLRLEGDVAASGASHEHFLALASRAMRRVLIDHARSRGSGKRGGGWQKVEISSVLSSENSSPAGPGPEIDLVQLDEVLTQLAEVSPRQAKIVELRFFGGVSNERAASILGISTPTLQRDWRVAQAWLLMKLGTYP